MVKVRKISDNSPSTPAKNTFSKNRSFSGVESKKTPKNRRKSIATVLPTPFKPKTKKVNEWIISEEVDNDEFAEKKTTSVADDALILSTPKLDKKKKRTLGNTTSSLESASKTIQKKTKLNTPKKVDNIHVSTDTVKSVKNKKKSKATSTPVNVKEKTIDIKPKPNSSSSEAPKNKKEATEPKGTLVIEDLQEKFNVKIEDVKKAVKGVMKLRSQNPKLENQLFAERYPLLLQICCVKVPRGHSKILRIPLPHSVLTPDDEVCLIIPEVKGIKNIEHEKHVEHYEELLRSKGVTNIKKIMTCHELRTEYETFEQRSRLVDLYDVFLVDGRVSGKVVKKCGKSFYKKRKVPIPVKLQASKLKEHVEKSLSKVFFFLHLKGNSYSVQFGHNEMDEEALVENVYSIIEFLDKQFPGGFKNFKGMQIYAPRATSIPIYMSLKASNDVIVPDVESKKPKAYKTYTDELTTLYNAEVIVQPSGEVQVKRKKSKRNAQDDEITDLDIIQANRVIGETDKETKKKSRKRKQNDETGMGEVLKKKKGSDVKESQEENVGGDGQVKEIGDNEKTDKIKKRRKFKQNGVGEVSKKKDLSVEESQGNVVYKGKIKKVGKVGSEINVQNKKLSEKVSTKDISKKKGPKVDHAGLGEEKDQNKKLSEKVSTKEISKKKGPKVDHAGLEEKDQNKKLSEKVSTKDISKKKGPKVDHAGLGEEKDQDVLNRVEKKQKRVKSPKMKDGERLMKKKINKRKTAGQE